MLPLYIDDIIVIGNDKSKKVALKYCLASEFEIKEFGKLYVTNLLKKTEKLACKPTSRPIAPYHKLGLTEEDLYVDREMCKRLLGKLIYLSCTRPDIAYAVSIVS